MKSRRIESEPYGNFGQVWWIQGESSPNIGELRTGLMDSKANESEQRATSDRFDGFKESTSPNIGELRTGLVVPKTIESEP